MISGGIKLAFLADHPEARAIVGRWYFEEWMRWVPGETLEKTIRDLDEYTNVDRVPLIVLALIDNEVVGAAQLKFREMDIFPEFEHWLGGVYVAANHRGSNIGAALAEQVAALAAAFGISRLYLQTERSDGGLYARQGWTPIEKPRYKGRQVLVMERDIRV